MEGQDLIKDDRDKFEKCAAATSKLVVMGNNKLVFIENIASER